MSLFSSAREDFERALSYGQQIIIRHYTGSVAGTEFDDAQTLTKSGVDVWVSGLVMPITAKQGSYEAVLIEQGKIKTTDKIVYLAGDVETTKTMKIGIGSPATMHSLLTPGIIAMPPVGDIVYKKLFLRELTLGSLTGE